MALHPPPSTLFIRSARLSHRPRSLHRSISTSPPSLAPAFALQHLEEEIYPHYESSPSEYAYSPQQSYQRARDVEQPAQRLKSTWDEQAEAKLLQKERKVIPPSPSSSIQQPAVQIRDKIQEEAKSAGPAYIEPKYTKAQLDSMFLNRLTRINSTVAYKRSRNRKASSLGQENSPNDEAELQPIFKRSKFYIAGQALSDRVKVDRRHGYVEEDRDAVWSRISAEAPAESSAGIQATGSGSPSISSSSGPDSSKSPSRHLSIPYDPNTMTLLSSISSFRRPAKKGHSPNEPDLSTLFAIKPKRNILPSTHRRYVEEYENLWNKIWVIFPVTKIIGIYNQMMSLPDPCDFSSGQQSAPEGHLSSSSPPSTMQNTPWPSTQPLGGAKTGIWVRDPTQPNGIRWQRAVKRTVVTEILTVWGWKPLEDVKMERKALKGLDRVVKQDYLLTEAESYLLVKRGGKEMKERWEDAVFTFVELENDGEGLLGEALRIRAKGREQLEIASFLEERKKAIAVHKIQNVDKSIERLQKSISHLTGAHLSYIQSTSTLQISYTSLSSLNAALSLLARIQFELLDTPKSASLVAFSGASSKSLPVPKPSPTFALYPFVSAGSTPADQWKYAGMSLYRMRRTGGWFGKEEKEKSDIAKEMVVLRGDLGNSTEESSLMDLLTHNISSLEAKQAGGDRSFVVSTGHLLYTKLSPSGPSLTSPLPGSRTMTEISEWQEKSGQSPLFVSAPSTPEVVTGMISDKTVLRYASMMPVGGVQKQTLLEIRQEGEVRHAFEVSQSVMHILRPEEERDIQIIERQSKPLSDLPAGLEAGETPMTILSDGKEFRLLSDVGFEREKCVKVKSVDEVMQVVRGI